jgi:hypothetical protein
VFENRILRRIFAPKGNEVTGGLEVYNAKLHSLYSSPNVIRQIKSRRMRLTGHVSRMGEQRTARRPRRIWEDGIRIDLREIDWWGAKWIQLPRIGNDGVLL